MRLPKKVPKRFWPYFWDVEAKNLDPHKQSLWIIQRLLDWNDFAAASWVLKTFPDKSIKDSLRDLRGWSRRSAYFWANYLNVPKDKILCLRPGFPNPPVSHWKY